MIISCSRRTDIPAFYSDWLMKRINEGFCTIPNPMNNKQISKVSLLPADVSLFVFWSQNPAPLIPYLPELDARGYRYYFQFTLNGYDRRIEPNVPDLHTGIETFRSLSRLIGAEKVIWRYDPLIISRKTDADYHIERFSYIAKALAEFTKRVVVSIVDSYRKTESRFRELDNIGYEIEKNPAESKYLAPIMTGLSEAARRDSLEIQSCAEDIDLRPFGVLPGKCVDNELIERIFGIRVAAGKDPSQRPACGCVQSRDIGVYNTCPAGCCYCYANTHNVNRLIG